MSTEQGVPARVGGSIVVADDSPTQLQWLAFLLEDAGYHVVTACNGREAFKMAQAVRPAMIVTDVNMPEMDGYDLCRAVKADASLAGIPVILLTTLTAVTDLVQGLECGADSFTMKPIVPDQLLARVAAILREADAPEAEAQRPGLSFSVGDKTFVIHASRRQILRLLLTSYETANTRTHELSTAQRALAHAAARIAEGDFAARVPEKEYGGELARLATAFNAMAGALSLSTAELRNSEERLRLLVSGVRDYAIIMLDPLGDIVTWNEGARGVTGCADSEVLGSPVTRFYTPDDNARGLPALLLAQARDEGRAETSCRWVRADGTLFYANVVISSMRGEGGTLLGYANVTRDITERWEATQRLESQKQRAEGIFEAAPDPVIIADAHGIVSAVNAQVEQAFGYARAELVGKPVSTLIPQLIDAMDAIDAIDVSQAAREMRARRRDGSEFAVEISRSPLRLPEGALAIITVRDISERKLAETKILTQVEHLRLLDHITRAVGERMDLKSLCQVLVNTLEVSLPVDFGCVCLYDPEARVLSVVSTGARSEPLARHMALEANIPLAAAPAEIARCLQGEQVYAADLAGTDVPLLQQFLGAGLQALMLAPLRSEKRVFGVLLVARSDAAGFSTAECEFMQQLSEHVSLAASQAQLYEALQKAYDDLRQSQEAAMQQERLRALGQLASGVAHDINNALSPVSLYVDSLLSSEDEELSPRARGYLETIQRAVDDVGETIARMREFYRPREQQLELKPVNLNEIARQVIDLTRVRWRNMAQQKGIAIEAVTDFAPDLPHIMGVESEIREALTNLVLNAADAMPQGGTLTLRTRPWKAADVDSVALEVADTGTGMDEDTRRRCLEPFFTTKGERGTGLGLAMVVGMVKRHSSQIEIDSAPGEGTTMRLIFMVPTEVVAETAGAAPRAVVTSQLRLLLVDDDPTLLRALSDALGGEGHAVTSANGGEDGIKAFDAALASETPYDIVITDLGMPRVDGHGVAAHVKQRSPETPTLMLTGWGKRMIAENDTPMNVDRVLAKPPKLQELRDALQQMVASRATAPSRTGGVR